MLWLALITAILPNGWFIHPASGIVVQTGTMPQGAAISPDGRKLAVVESGFNAPTLSIYRTSDLHLLHKFPLKGAFGPPEWTAYAILVAGANADVVYRIDAERGIAGAVATGKNSYPVAVAERRGVVAVSLDGNGSVIVAPLTALKNAKAVRVGAHPGNLAFDSDGRTVFAAVRSSDYVAAIDLRNGHVRRIATGLHPSDVLVRDNRLYVAQADADSVAVFDTRTLNRTATIAVGGLSSYTGSSPNALGAGSDFIAVSLGAANQIAIIRNGRVVRRFAAGWYPTDIAVTGTHVYAIDGKGEGTKPNPAFDVFSPGYRDYIAAIQYGSIRRIDLSDRSASNSPGQIGYRNGAGASTVLRKDGPIRHIFFILKENRTYDQILGDVRTGNGDAKLAWFGGRVTPNQHALSQRFGLFDNFYASGEVSDAGHNWADAAFANDYVERNWPPAYGRRRDNDDILTGTGAPLPAGGYIWDAARAAHVSFRDYGEMVHMPETGTLPPTTAPTVDGRYDARYVGWNLDYSDLDRVKEWQREFDAFVKSGDVPQLEYMWLPNDHTYGSRVGKFTPAAYIATNDYAVGLIVQTISHSKIWPSSVIFITEDDAQDGADHVSDQRTTLYIASPYARGGTVHQHYSTVGVLRTIELCLGMKPLSAYDATAVPLYDAFETQAHLQPFDALPPQIDVTARNAKTAYGERLSERADFSRPDAASGRTLTAILSRNRAYRIVHR
ncbi:MAG: hypothetical protein JO165_01705 [Candidatus Eremiobacteraeota bacterium]|nr:hypothetical protein [Candidatus Eremiobacteraeota bacterium]